MSEPRPPHVSPQNKVSMQVLHYLERNLGRSVRAVVERDYGFEGRLAAVSQNPPGIWLSDADAVILRGTIVNPLPTVVSRENMSEIFVNMNSLLRLEIISKK